MRKLTTKLVPFRPYFTCNGTREWQTGDDLAALAAAAERAKIGGDYDGYWRARRAYLLAQAAAWEAQHAPEQPEPTVVRVGAFSRDGEYGR